MLVFGGVVLKWEWIEIHILSMLLFIHAWEKVQPQRLTLQVSYKLPRERLIDGQESFIGDFQDLNQS